MLTESNLQERIANIANDYVIYGDPAYYFADGITTGFPGNINSDIENEFNSIMSKARVSVEWKFGRILSLFPGLRNAKQMKILLSPVGLFYRVGVMLSNVHNCYHPNQIAQFFRCQPLS